MARTARRDAGAGAVYQRADGRWIAALELPEDMTTGKRRRKVMSSKTKAGVLAKLNAAKTDLDKAGDLPTSSPTVAQWLTRWQREHVDGRLKPRTAEGYRGIIDRYLLPHLGKKRLDRLTQRDVFAMEEAMIARGLSSTTALQAHRVLAKALTDAERQGLVSRNVAKLMDAPSKAVSTRGALTADDAKKLLRSVADDPVLFPAFMLALHAGLRRGEILGLHWQDVDLNAGTLTVQWQLQSLSWLHGCGGTCGRKRGGNCPERKAPAPQGHEIVAVSDGLWLVRPKSRRGWRVVPMTPALIETLRRIRPDGARGLIFDMNPDDLTRAWPAALAAAGLPPAPLHSARHTASSVLAANGMDAQQRMAILGHASVATTEGYTHWQIEQLRPGMDALGDALALD